MTHSRNVHDVSGCAKCPAGDVFCQILVKDPRYVIDDDGNPLSVAPDWCPLRKGPVTLKLKEGA